MNFRRDLTIRLELPEPLTAHNKQELLLRSPEEYLKDQQSILKWLLSSRQNFRKYFERFYQNHVNVDKWLASQSERLKEYRFCSFLVHSLEQYESKMNMKGGKQSTLLRSSINARKLDFDPFQKRAVLEGYFASNPQPTLPRQSTILKELKFVSSYDFYRDTFHACQGKKYISYDCKFIKYLDERHMRARNQQTPGLKYPSRLKHFTHNALQRTVGVSLSSQQWNTSEALVPTEKIRKLLLSRELSSRLVRQEHSIPTEGPRRVMVINHSGKPLYYNLR